MNILLTQLPKYICVLDFEATCDGKSRDFDHEI